MCGGCRRSIAGLFRGRCGRISGLDVENPVLRAAGSSRIRRRRPAGLVAVHRGRKRRCSAIAGFSWRHSPFAKTATASLSASDRLLQVRISRARRGSFSEKSAKQDAKTASASGWPRCGKGLSDVGFVSFSAEVAGGLIIPWSWVRSPPLGMFSFRQQVRIVCSVFSPAGRLLAVPSASGTPSSRKFAEHRMIIRWLIQCREATTGLSPRCSMRRRRRKPKIKPPQPGDYSERLLAVARFRAPP